MMKKGFMMLVVMVLLLGITSSAVSAQYKKATNWTPAGNYPNINIQYVSQSGDYWDGVRWANQNPHKVKISVKFFPSSTGTNVGERVIYLEAVNAMSEIVQLAPGGKVNFSVEKI